jgi:hypothetical protein
MPEFWKDVLGAVNSLLLHMHYREFLNERYLHHFFSHQLQSIKPCPMPLLDPTTPLRFHPEWPTYKKATGIDCGKYRETDGRYLPVDTGNKTDGGYWPVDSGKEGGFVDFALGPYLTPEVGVEFKLLGGWQAKGVVFDYVKLLDRRNPFKAVVSVVVLLRPNGLAAAGRKEAICDAINLAYQEAVRRLDHGPFSPVADRLQRFVVTELGPKERRHWYNGSVGGSFVEGAGVPPLPE